MPEPTATRSPNPWLQLLGNRQYLWLLSGNTALFFAFSATQLLRSLLAWQLTGDEMALAYIGLIAAVCMFVTAIFSGAIIDRLERRRLMLFAQGLIWLAEASILTLLVTGHITFGFLIISVFVTSITFPFILPARTIMMVSAVGRAKLRRAAAMLSAGFNLAQMVSPAVVGIVVDRTTIAYGYVYLLAMLTTTLVCTFKLCPNAPEPGIQHGAVLLEIGNGFRYIIGNRPLALCMLFGLVPMLIAVPMQNLMVVFVEELWGRGSSGLGIMMAATGMGGLTGTLLMALVREGSLVKLMTSATLLMGLLLVGVSQSPWFSMAVAFVFGVYTCSVLTQTLVSTSVQLMADDRYRGRISTTAMMVFGLCPAGSVPIAFAVKYIGPSMGLLLAAMVLIATVLIMWFLVPAFRKIDEATRAH